MRSLKRARNWSRGNRLVYAIERLWLRRPVRLAFRILLPGVVTFAIAHAWLTRPGVMEGLEARYLTALEWVETRPELQVKALKITGASHELEEDIHEVLALDFPMSMIGLDLEAVRASVASLDAVASSHVALEDGVLEIRVTERKPAVVWQGPDEMEVLDAEGHRVASLGDREKRRDLPLIAGEGADRAVSEALALIEGAGRLRPAIRVLVRIGERRWDVVLENGVHIALPERGARAALARLLVLDRIHDLFSRQIQLVDLRVAERPVVRLAPSAIPVVFPGAAAEPAVLVPIPVLAIRSEEGARAKAGPAASDEAAAARQVATETIIRRKEGTE